MPRAIGQGEETMQSTGRFTGKVALITAVANGIGRATAEIMAREGATVVGVDNRQGPLDAAIGSMTSAGGQAHGKLCDALDEAQVNETVAAAEKEFGHIDILVNAVGGSTVVAKPGAPLDELSFADWQKLIDFNLSGTFLFTHAVAPIMKRQRAGKIVSLASIAGRGRSESSSAAYAAAKGGIIALTKKLCYELGPYGVNINAIAPSVTHRAHPAALGAAQPGRPGARDRPHAAAPGRRGGRPGEGDLLSRVERRRFCHRRHDRRHRRELTLTAVIARRVSDEAISIGFGLLGDEIASLCSR
jgi:NAD(P)-dependent dehydrogenase (short-subunit alcohol dehydrogenase family)